MGDCGRLDRRQRVPAGQLREFHQHLAGRHPRQLCQRPDRERGHGKDLQVQGRRGLVCEAAACPRLPVGLRELLDRESGFRLADEGDPYEQAREVRLHLRRPRGGDQRGARKRAHRHAAGVVQGHGQERAGPALEPQRSGHAETPLRHSETRGRQQGWHQRGVVVHADPHRGRFGQGARRRRLGRRWTRPLRRVPVTRQSVERQRRQLQASDGQCGDSEFAQNHGLGRQARVRLHPWTALRLHHDHDGSGPRRLAHQGFVD
mmetsp:Transcript_120996/g.347656  ORF Transcript_120996/g.347656 Transcript_120996/m.347656 type:complete len:261 (-) Transcript_120996:2601-3383(-)